LITIANDIAGLVLVGGVYPTAGLRLTWLLLTAIAVAGVWFFSGRFARPGRTEREHRRAFALWPYVVAGLVSWLGVLLAGLPGALGLIPVIPAIPHADRAFGLFALAEEFLYDPLNRLAHALVTPLGAVLFLFGLTRGGIDLWAIAPTTGTVLAALWIGKPLGVILGALLAVRMFALELPQGVRMRDLMLVAVISGMGFTVPVLVLDSALPGGGMAEAARAGLALSLLAGLAALALGRFVQKA
jgi:NhaA family Na+:H+ antiporter